MRKYHKITHLELNMWVVENYRFKKDFLHDLWEYVGFPCVNQSDMYQHLSGQNGFSNTTAAMYMMFIKHKENIRITERNL